MRKNNHCQQPEVFACQGGEENQNLFLRKRELSKCGGFDAKFPC